MATEITFHLDENVDHPVARGLRLRGIEVTTTTDAGLVSESDESHVAFANSTGRVIVTHDPDFLVLHANGIKHPGIVFLPDGNTPIGEAVRFLCLLHECVSADEMRGQLEYA